MPRFFNALNFLPNTSNSNAFEAILSANTQPASSLNLTFNLSFNLILLPARDSHALDGFSNEKAAAPCNSPRLCALAACDLLELCHALFEKVDRRCAGNEGRVIQQFLMQR